MTSSSNSAIPHGELVDVGTVKFDLDMNMPAWWMHSGATIAPTAYLANIAPRSNPTWG